MIKEYMCTCAPPRPYKVLGKAHFSLLSTKVRMTRDRSRPASNFIVQSRLPLLPLQFSFINLPGLEARENNKGIAQSKKPVQLAFGPHGDIKRYKSLKRLESVPVEGMAN